LRGGVQRDSSTEREKTVELTAMLPDVRPARVEVKLRDPKLKAKTIRGYFP